MGLLSLCCVCLICLQIQVFAELSSSSCSLLRTATSISTIVPEIAQLTMRYYHSSSSSSSDSSHHREKRFLFKENLSKDGIGIGLKATVFEQMIANAFKDVDYTKVAALILNNNETITKIRQNIDGEAIIRVAMRGIDYEKLGRSLYYAAEAEFDLEYMMGSFINMTSLDSIHEELVTNGTVPDWFIKSIHPNLNVQTVQRMFEMLKNFTNKFVNVMNSTERLDDYLFNMIQDQALTPLGTIIQRIKDEQPTTLDQLVEIILNNVNKIVKDNFMTTVQPVIVKKTGKKLPKNEPSTTTMAMLEESNDEDVRLLFYQCSIAIESIGQTARIALKALEQLYCTSVWE